MITWGVKPQALIGHSIGEYVAACLAGVFSLEDALRLVAARGRLMQGVAEGAMMAVAAPPEELAHLLMDGVCLAAVNEPSMCVLSGPAASIERIEQECAADGKTLYRLYTSHAFHSEMMEPILPAFVECLQGVRLNAPQIPFISNVTGTWISPGDATDPDYWVRHLRSTVQFADGIGELLREPGRVLVELGPGTSLSGMVDRHPECQATQSAIPVMRHVRDHREDRESLLEAVGRLWLAGVSSDWNGDSPFVFGKKSRYRVMVPRTLMEAPSDADYGGAGARQRTGVMLVGLRRRRWTGAAAPCKSCGAGSGGVSGQAGSCLRTTGSECFRDPRRGSVSLPFATSGSAQRRAFSGQDHVSVGHG
jgi:acyl transferase domain-containing protein